MRISASTAKRQKGTLTDGVDVNGMKRGEVGEACSAARAYETDIGKAYKAKLNGPKKPPTFLPGVDYSYPDW